MNFFAGAKHANDKIFDFFCCIASMQVYVDHRESTDIIRLVQELFSETQTMQLPLGDIFLVTSPRSGVLIERKSVNDFVISMRSNHLWEQLLRMMKTKVLLGVPIIRRMLVIHGQFERYLNELPMDITLEGQPSKFWNSICGAIQEVLFVYDTPVFFAENLHAMKAFLQTLGKREAQGKNDGEPKSRWMRRRIRDQLPMKDSRRILLATVPSIGETLATNLLGTFPTIHDVACASIEDLQSINGIGKKKAQKIYHLFH